MRFTPLIFPVWLIFISPLLADVSTLKSSAPIVEGLWQAVRTASRIEVLEGLPHPAFESRLRELEEVRVKPMQITSELFYPEILTAPSETIQRLTEFLVDPASLKKPLTLYNANRVTFCGGFHADYAVIWKDQNAIGATALICFGCSEVRFIRSKDILESSFTPERHRLLFALLKPLRHARPITDFFRQLDRARKAGYFTPESPTKIDISR